MDNIKTWPLCEQDLVDLYINQNLNIKDICLLYDVTFDAVRYYLRKFKICKDKQTRNAKQADTWHKKTSDEMVEICNKRKEYCLDKYNVDNPMKTEAVKIKIKNTNLGRYGVENPSSLDEIKEKKKDTCRLKYGVDCVLSSNDIRNKIKETNLSRYGVENPMQSKEIKNRVFDTNLERYGFKSAIQSKEVQEKLKSTCLNKYGVEYPGMTENAKTKRKETCIAKFGVDNPIKADTVRKKALETNIEKYGCENPMQSEVVKEKARKTNLDKYGFDNCLKSPDIRDKIKKTNLRKYGCEHPMQNSEIRHKIMESLASHNNVPTSKQQIRLFNILSDKYGASQTLLNYVVDDIIIDVFIILNGQKIAVEYDGWYWHKDKLNKDRKRDYFLYSQGYKVLRIRSAYDLPSEDELFSAIDYLINTEHHHKIIILQDWIDLDEKIKNKE